ncbi:MAG: ABC transporter permease [Anaerolineales bacterium]|nr:ABC transporter permease [Anaerolineales bacterium]
MTLDALIIGLAGVVATASPVILATVGETLSERAGVINLSVNGTIILAAMASFAVAVNTDSLVLGFLAGAVAGAVVSAIVAFTSITLRQSQVAVGYVLALMARDTAYFLGNPYMGSSGPRVPALPIPGLREIPFLGPILFDQDLVTYMSILIALIAWWWIYRTRPGLLVRGAGERPSAAFVRGADVVRLRYFYTILGGALVGLAGPAFSLSVKAGWKGTISGLDGIGWIALALTIFGGWNPIRGALGALLFALLQWLGLVLQPLLPGIPSQVLRVAPFPLMILSLLLVGVGSTEWVNRTLAGLPEDVRQLIRRALRALEVRPPAALGQHFDRE